MVRKSSIDPKVPVTGKQRRISSTSKFFTLGPYGANDDYAATWVYGLLFFKEDIQLDTIMDLVKEKILEMPRFRSVYNPKKRAFVEQDPQEIDMSYHIKCVDEVMDVQTIQDEFVGSAYKHFEFDKGKPLWQFTYFPRISDGRALLLTNINHIIGDGVAQIELVHLLFDAENHAGSSEGVSRPPKRKKPKNLFGPLNKTRIFMGGIWDGILGTLEKPDSESILMREDPMKGGDMKTAFSDDIEFSNIKDLKEKFEGATVNDILVTLLTLTIRAYLLENEPEALSGKRKLRASFPINRRKNGQSGFRDGSPHNSIGLGVFKFPLKFKSRVDSLWKVKRTLDKIKLSPKPVIQAAFGDVLVNLLNPKSSYKLFSQVSAGTTCQLSSVAGPPNGASIGGHHVQDLKFLLNSPVGLYLGLITYNGNVSTGICVDDTAKADAQEIAKFWKSEFDSFYEEVMSIDGVIKRPRSFIDRL